MMENKDQQVFGSQLLPHETWAKPFYSADDRHEHVTSPQLLEPRMIRCPTLITGCYWAATPILFILSFFFTNLQTFAIPCGVVLMGFCVFQLLATAAMRNTTKWHIRTSILTSIILAAFAAMSFCPWTSMLVVRAATALVIAFLQISLFVWTLRTSPSAGTDLQNVYYGSLKSVCWIATTASLAFLLKSFQIDSPPMWSLACSVACLLWFAYGTLVAALTMNGPRGQWNEPAVYSCDAVSDYENDNCWNPTFPTGQPIGLAFIFFGMWPSLNMCDWIVGTLFASWMVLPLYALELPCMAACRFHILPNASIVVETMDKLYVYEQVLHAEVEAKMIGPPPEHTKTCHVYCTFSPRGRVKIQLAGERWLYLTPKHPTEFANAITSAIS